MKRLFIFFFLTPFLFADELTTDIQPIWPENCLHCTPPPCICPPDIPLQIDLLNPLYQDGVITTSEGGVLAIEDLRMQAMHIRYTKTENACHVFCQGNLLVDYAGRALVGDSLFFDFHTFSGTLIRGKTAAFPWFISGERIELCTDGTLIVKNGMITTSECGENEVAARAETIVITKERVLTAKKIDLCVKGVSLLSFPCFSLDLKTKRESPLSFNAGWNGFLGSHVGVKYEFLNIDDFKAFARLDGYFGHGLGVGVETEYDPPCSSTTFFTRSYYAHDLAIDDPKKKDRYRLQGTYFTRTNLNTTISAIYDFVSDAQFAQDYTHKSFALNPAYKTELRLRREVPLCIANLSTRVRVNSFQSINQELPTFALTFHPVEIFDSAIILDHAFKFSYLSYVFSDEVIDRHDFKSGRFEERLKIYRPFAFGPIKLTPSARFVGIFYTNNPEKRPVGQAVGDFAFHGEMAASRCFGPLSHTFFPYVDYHLLTAPKASLNKHFLFTIQDAYAHLSLLRFGVRNALFFGEALWFDVWANAFFDKAKVPQIIPKGYLNLEWQFHPRLYFEIDTAWNFAHRTLDFFNERVLWTMSQNVALAAEYRHRSRFDWRKGDFYDFLLDATRSEDLLLASPLSERRDIVLGKLFYRFSPDFSMQGEIRRGWHRAHQRPFLEYQIELETRLFQHYKFFITYEKRTEDTRFFITLKLDKGAPPLQKWRSPC